MPTFENARYHVRWAARMGPRPTSKRFLHFDRFAPVPAGPCGGAAEPAGPLCSTRRLVPWRVCAFGVLVLLTVVGIILFDRDGGTSINGPSQDAIMPSVEASPPVTSRPPVVDSRNYGDMPLQGRILAPMPQDLSDEPGRAPPLVDRLASPPIPLERIREGFTLCRAEAIPLGDGVLACRGLEPLDGRMSSSVVPVADASVGILGAIGAKIGVPTGVVTIKAEGETVGRDAYLAAMSVNDQGRIVSASPMSQRLASYLVTAALVFAAGACATGAVRALRRSEGSFVGPGDTSFYFGALACLAAASAFGSGLPGVPGWEFGLLTAVAAVSCGDCRTGVARMSLAVALCAFVDLLQVPIAPPSPQLASLYGPAGLYGWDFVFLSTAVLLGLWLPGRTRHL